MNIALLYVFKRGNILLSTLSVKAISFHSNLYQVFSGVL